MSWAAIVFSVVSGLVITPILTLAGSKFTYERSKSVFKASVCTALLASALVSLAIAARIAFDRANLNATALAAAYVSAWYLFSATGAIKSAPTRIGSQAVLGTFAISITLFALISALSYQNMEPIYMSQYSKGFTCRVYAVGVASNNAPMLEAEVHQWTAWIPGLHRQIYVQPFAESSDQPTPSEACAAAKPFMSLGGAVSITKGNAAPRNSAPNWAFKRTPTLAMASPFSWPVSVPSALSGYGAA